MLDVETPENDPHTWREFFAHMGTLVLGLLIALALEQTAEAIHHHSEAVELRAELRTESENVSRDSGLALQILNRRMAWLDEKIVDAKDGVWNKHRLPEASPAPNDQDFISPDAPLWRAAKISGLAPRLKREEIISFSEVEFISQKIESARDQWREAENKRTQFENIFPNRPDGKIDFAKANDTEAKEYLRLLVCERDALKSFQLWVLVMQGAEEAIKGGSRDMDEILKSERKYYAPAAVK